MRIQINTTDKLITLLEPCNIVELVDWLQMAFKDEYKEYRIESPIYNYTGFYPWYQYKWYEPISTPVTEPIYNVHLT